jgi:hypothetical protein
MSNPEQEQGDTLEGGCCAVDPNVVEGETCNLAISVVKMKMNSFCPDKRIREKIGVMVRDMNIIVAEAYKFANLHITRLLTSGTGLPIIDRNFYYRCLLAVSVNKCRAGTLGETFVATMKEFDALRPSDEPRVNATEYNQVLAGMSITMATMADNHLWMNLEGRLKRYLSWKHPDLKRHTRAIITAVVSRPKVAVDSVITWRGKGAISEKVQRARGVATELRGLMPLPSKLQSKTRSFLTLPLYRKMLMDTEHAREEASIADPKARFRGRTFTLLPNKSGFTVAYIPISTMTMLAILKRLGLEKFEGDGRDLQSTPVWRRHFNLNAVETEKCRFGGSMYTDGCGVSVVMDKKTCMCAAPCKVDKERLLQLYKDGVNVVGVDPGFTDVATIATRGGKVATYSSAKYYDRAMYNMSRRRTDRWNSDTQAIAQAILPDETADVELLKNHTQSYLASLRALLDHRLTRGYRNMRFMRYCSKKRAIQEICDMIAPPGGKTVVGFGDWSGGSGTPISRRCAGPLQEIKLELMHRDEVTFMSIHERRTSQTCHHCLNKLVNMRAKSTVYKRKEKAMVQRDTTKIHKVLHCKSSHGSQERCCGTTWNRDVNAAKNILMLTMFEMLGYPRPSPF